MKMEKEGGNKSTKSSVPLKKISIREQDLGQWVEDRRCLFGGRNYTTQELASWFYA